jgi:hypothetical protein
MFGHNERRTFSASTKTFGACLESRLDRSVISDGRAGKARPS